MTDRHIAYMVTLDEPIREDDAEAIMSALRHIRGVIDVRPVVTGMEQMAGAFRIEAEWRNALLELAENGPAEKD